MTVHIRICTRQSRTKPEDWISRCSCGAVFVAASYDQSRQQAEAHKATAYRKDPL